MIQDNERTNTKAYKQVLAEIREKFPDVPFSTY